MRVVTVSPLALLAACGDQRYRSTPLRGLWQHAPYSMTASAATLEAVVSHYDATLGLGLSAQQKADLMAYLGTL